MGAWAKDPVPGAAAGAHPGRRSNITPGTGNSTPGHQNGPRGGAGHRVFRPCAHGPWPLVVYYYIITPLFYIIILFYVFSTVRFYSAPCGFKLHRAFSFCIIPCPLMCAPFSHFPNTVRAQAKHCLGFNLPSRI